jgi:large subunit ribosomal protein L34e
MVQGNLKSRRLGRVQVKTINGTKTHYVQRNRQIAKCAITGKPLRGIPRKTNRQFKNLNKSQKTISRAYGGYMSHTALKTKILKEMILNNEQ